MPPLTFLSSMNPTDYINEYREQRRKAQYAVRKLYGPSFGPGEEKRRKEALLAKAANIFLSELLAARY